MRLELPYGDRNYTLELPSNTVQKVLEGTPLPVPESEEKEVLRALEAPIDSNQAREEALRRSYTIGGYMGYHAAVIAENNDIAVVTDLEDGLVRSMGMIPLATLEEGMEFVKRKHGQVPSCYVMPHAGTTLPRLKGGQAR